MMAVERQRGLGYDPVNGRPYLQEYFSPETPECPVCHRVSRMTVERHRYNFWVEGLAIEAALPELSDAERAQIVTGIHA